jgi:hypothetical protein
VEPAQLGDPRMYVDAETQLRDSPTYTLALLWARPVVIRQKKDQDALALAQLLRGHQEA